jgi:hypothetical protein
MGQPPEAPTIGQVAAVVVLLLLAAMQPLPLLEMAETERFQVLAAVASHTLAAAVVGWGHPVERLVLAALAAAAQAENRRPQEHLELQILVAVVVALEMTESRQEQAAPASS